MGLNRGRKTMARSSQGSYVLVLTTCGTRREALRIAQSIVKLRLGACVTVSVQPVSSVYRWKGKIEQAKEFSLLIKTTRPKLAALQTEIKRLHSYEVPEFLVLPVAGGSPAYLAWLNDCLQPAMPTGR